MVNTAYLSWSVDVDCPKCGESNDLSKSDDDKVVANAIFHNNWDALKGFEVICESCKHAFILDAVEY